MEVKNQKVKRGKVSKVPLLIVLGLCTVLLTAGFFAVQRSPDKEEASSERSKALFADAKAQIARMQSESTAARKESPAPAPDALPPEEKPLTEAQALEIYERLREEEPKVQEDPYAALKEQRQAAFVQALSSGSTVALRFDGQAFVGGGSMQSGSVQGGLLSDNQRRSLESSKEKLNALKGGKSAGAGGTLSAYDALSDGPDFALPYQVESVDTPYIIRQGAVVPAVLLTGINSDIPGQVLAQTTAPVYDSPLGNYELIPAGSRLIGQYVAQPAYGTERVMLAFSRIVFPDGKSLTLGAMPGSALDGYAGFDAEVNNHMFRLLSGALLLGGITAMVSVSQDDVYDDDGHITVSSAMTQAIGASLGQVLAQVVERNINIAPTLEVKPGYCFNLTLVKDLRFKGPYRAFDYAAG